jgi:hypothetical protein
MKPERIYEIAKEITAGNYGAEFAFSPSELMDFVIIILEEAHLEKAEREFDLNR